MIKYQFKDGIFTVNFTGQILFTEIIEYLEDFRNLKDIPLNLRMLYDLTESDFTLTQAEIRKLSEKASQVTAHFNFIYTAFVVSEPKITAYTMLFSLMAPNEKSLRELFATKENALTWLNNLHV